MYMMIETDIAGRSVRAGFNVAEGDAVRCIEVHKHLDNGQASMLQKVMQCAALKCINI